MNKIQMIASRQDAFGNKLTYNEETGELKIKQPNEDRWRSIGNIVSKNGKMVYVKHEKEEDKYLKYKAWSVYHIILDMVDGIRYETEEFTYSISVNNLKKKGRMHKDKGTGMGGKYVCPVRHWKIKPKFESEARLLDILGYEWYDELRSLFRSPKTKELVKYVNQQRMNVMTYPAKDALFNSFKATPYTETKVILLDEGCYNQNTNGVAYCKAKRTMKDDIPELEAMLEAIETVHYDGFQLNRDEDLSHLPKQGVLLLNAVMTSTKYSRLAHKNSGWIAFTKRIITQLLDDKLHRPVVIILLGDRLQEWYKEDLEKHLNGKHQIICAPYPKKDALDEFPDIFKDCNTILKSNKLTPIQW